MFVLNCFKFQDFFQFFHKVAVVLFSQLSRKKAKLVDGLFLLNGFDKRRN